jgi:hypothetical protein
MKNASIFTIIVAAFIINNCVEQINSDSTEPDALAGLEDNLPENWHYLKVGDFDTTKIPVGMGDPVQVSRVYKAEQPQPADTLSILLFFFPLEEKEMIDSIIQAQTMSSWCIPIFFAESSAHYVITSPCYIHSSSVAERGMEINSVIEIVKSYISSK